jgi:RNA polymerase sigma-70 factor (ECF subfamily)
MSRDEAWFERLYERNRPMIRAYCVRRVGSVDAQDIESQVFAVAWRRRDDVPEPDRELPWLYGVARRTLGHHWRSAARARRLVEKAGVVPTDVSPGPEVVAAATAEQALVREALAALKPADREVLLLAAWEGLTHAHIGEVVGCSLAAADKRVTRAKARLADRYASLVSATDGSDADPPASRSSLVHVRRGGGAA